MGHNRKIGVGVDGRTTRKRWGRGRRKPVPFAVFVFATCIAAIGAVAACATGISRISEPYQHHAEQESQIADLHATLNSLNDSNTKLQRQLNSLNTQEGIETAARGQRFVEPGEILLNINATPAQPPVPVDNSFGAELKRAWDKLAGK